MLLPSKKVYKTIIPSCLIRTIDTVLVNCSVLRRRTAYIFYQVVTVTMRKVSNRRKFVGASIVLVLTLSVLLSSFIPASIEAKKQYQLTVKLTNVKWNYGDYTVTVRTMYEGFDTLKRSKVVDTSYRQCPDDVDSKCYTNAGQFYFPANKVAKKTQLEVCAYEPIGDNENCAYYVQTGKWPPLLKVAVPDKP